jgi:hypothetical protein
MNKERAGSLIFLLTGMYGFIFSIGLPMGKWNEPGPGIFPLCLSILLCISGILGFIRRKTEGGENTGIEWRVQISELAVPLQIVGLTAAFILILDQVGYLMASTFYLFVLLFWVSRYKLRTSIGLAIALGVGSWCFFEKLLAIDLPAMGFWIL